MNKIKLGNFGLLGILGFVGFIVKTSLNLHALFCLFFLFFIDIIPGIIKRLLFIFVLTLLIIGGLLNSIIVQIIINLFFVCIFIYWIYCFFYPTNNKWVNNKESLLLSNQNMSIKDGITVYLEKEKLTGFNKKYQNMYDKLAPFYDLFQSFAYFFWNGEEKVRMEYLKELNIKDGDKVLEVSVGTGGNLHYLPSNAVYYGLDISWGMLKQCQKNLSRWNKIAYLFLGEAENLPFKNNVFDTVFHVGGINFFNDKKKAVDEMIRVAKSGARILIADETEEIAKGAHQIPGIKDFYNQDKNMYRAPLDLIPKEMKNIQIKKVFGENMFCITFNKP